MAGEIPPVPEPPQEKENEPPFPSREAKEQPRVEIKDSRGVVFGNFARVVINGIDDKLFKRFGLGVNLGFALLAVLVVSATTLIVYILLPKQGNMQQDVGCYLCIAVADFVVDSDTGDPGIGKEIGAQLSRRLLENLTDLDADASLSIDVWEPARVPSLKGKTIAELDHDAPRVAKQAGADILVYGLIKVTGDQWEVTPRFYISPDFVIDDAPEVTGQDQLGAPYEVTGRNEALRKKHLGEQAEANARLMTALAIGLVHYIDYEYDAALKVFETARKDSQDWGDPGAVRLLYLMMGNCLLTQAERNPGQVELLDQAQQKFQAALATDEKYARPYIGLGSVSYLKAMTPAMHSSNPADADPALLAESLNYYRQAQLLAPNPDLVNVREKTQTYTGRVLLAEDLAEYSASSQLPDLKPAALEFTRVIQSYDRTPNNGILKDLAVEAHAGLGMIARLEGRKSDAIAEYQAALDLMDPDYDPVKRTMYQKILQALQAAEP